MFAIYFKHVYDIYVYTNTQGLCFCVLHTKSSAMGIYVNWINVNPSMDMQLQRL